MAEPAVDRIGDSNPAEYGAALTSPARVTGLLMGRGVARELPTPGAGPYPAGAGHGLLRGVIVRVRWAVAFPELLVAVMVTG